MSYEWMQTPVFMIITQIYFAFFGTITMYYAFKTKNNPEKVGHPEFFKNEILISLMFWFLVVAYPFIFDNYMDTIVKHQVYFHIWDSLTVHYIVWQIYFLFAARNNKKHNRYMPYEDFKKHIYEVNEKRSDNLSNIKRKLLHLIPPSILLGMYAIGLALDPMLQPVGWNWQIFTIFMGFTVSIHFMFVGLIADLYRLLNFNKLGKFGRDIIEDTIRPKEMDTLTSANAMMLSMIPLFFAPMFILFSAVAIASIADAMASIIGKAFGKIRNPNSPKTIEGYAAGTITSFLIVIGMSYIVPLEGANMGLIVILAVCGALGYLLVDIKTVHIHDNLLCPFVSGGLMWLAYIIFV